MMKSQAASAQAYRSGRNQDDLQSFLPQACKRMRNRFQTRHTHGAVGSGHHIGANLDHNAPGAAKQAGPIPDPSLEID
jgi:hypothetical protein